MLKSRSGSQGSSSATPPQTIEVVRRRARHRLIGAAILVLVGVLGFPLLFDTEPRPVAGDIPIEIPSRTSTSVVAKAEIAAPKENPAVLPKAEKPLSAKEGLDTREEVVESVAPPKSAPMEPVDNAAARDAAKKAQKEAARNKAKEQDRVKEGQLAVADKAKNEAAEAARAKALLEAKAPPAGNERLVVQVGAFADPTSARTARLTLERAGMTTYTHVAETAAGKLIRVRVGPYASRAEADKAAAKVKTLGLPARILAL
ncbi:MAG: SPOR domain-containing protein [Hydrogenophaga sp.]